MKRLLWLLVFLPIYSWGQVIITIAGNTAIGLNNGNSLGDNGPAINAGLNDPTAIAFDAIGNLYIADANSFKIRKISTSGIITTIAGGGVNNPGDNGPAILANLDHPNGVSIDAAGRVYEAEANSRIRMISTSGIITTVAGNGTSGYSGDNGPATSAQIGLPPSVTVDASGNIYIPDANNGRVRKVNVSSNIITTIAGDGSFGYNGDAIPASTAVLNGPFSVAIDISNNIYVSDYWNNRIRKIDNTTTLISTVAGSGIGGFYGDNGLATSAQINGPYKICLDNLGNIYIPDILNQRVRKVDAVTGIITTIAGNGVQGYGGDGGLAINAQLNNPMSVAVDVSGNIYIADAYNNRIRKICISATLPTISITANPTGAICSGTAVTFTATPGSATSPSYQWIKNGANVGTNSSTYTYIPANGDSVRCIITKTDACAGVLSASSNTINMTVNPAVTPTISITANPTGAVCSGTSVTYTATISNGGTTPSYQWIKNGSNVGTNSVTYTYTPNNNDSIRCVLISSAVCTTPVSSNTINMTVNPTVTPTIAITANPTGAICSGTSVTYTATISNGGTTPSYQWIKNGANAGTNSSTYTYTPNNNDSIRCVLISSIACTTPVSSNTINMTVNPTVVPSVSITANPSSTVCTGTSVTFTATPTNGGSTPSYQWQKNGINVGTNSATYTYIPANGDQIKCTLSSNATCANPTTATSNIITMTVSSSIVPAVTVTVSPNDTVCAGTTVTYTASQTGGGSTPGYQWIKNGANAGTNSNTYSYIPNNIDSVRCVLTSNASCASPTTASSNSIHMTVQTTVIPTVAISISPNDTVCTGTSVTLTATTTNGGTTPNYLWTRNGTATGGNSSTYNYTPNNNDTIRCELISNASCASPTTANSNSINITVDTLIVPIISITAPVGAATGTSVTATATVSNAGSSYTIYWLNHGVIFATTNIPPSTGNSTTYTKGAGTDSLTAKIVVTSGGCYDSTTTPTITTVTATTGISHIANNSYIQVYPNPTNNLLHIDNILQATSYQLQNIVGQAVQQGIFTQQNNTLQIKELPAGIYLLQLTNVESNPPTSQLRRAKEVIRVVKQ